MSKTIIYYSSNRENPDFEKRVMINIKILSKIYGISIVSVTQKPLSFGHNIVVGDVGASGFNMFRQVQIALKEVKTDYVVSTESDCLYPPDYFNVEPEDLNTCYRNSNLYVMPDARDYYFYKKEGASHAQVVGTKYYLDTLNKLFEGAPQWSVEEKNFPKERWKKEDIFDKISYFHTQNPVVQIKTHKGMRYFTHSDRTPITYIPYWGEGKHVRSYYLHGKE